MVALLAVVLVAFVSQAFGMTDVDTAYGWNSRVSGTEQDSTSPWPNTMLMTRPMDICMEPTPIWPDSTDRF